LIILTPDFPMKLNDFTISNPSDVFFELMKGAISGVESIKWVGIDGS
jgi:hypothetical protein